MIHTILPGDTVRLNALYSDRTDSTQRGQYYKVVQEIENDEFIIQRARTRYIVHRRYLDVVSRPHIKETPIPTLSAFEVLAARDALKEKQKWENLKF